MGRKSALSDEQWIEIERKHLVDGVSINALAKEYNVNESTIRRKIKPNKAEPGKTLNPLAALASDKVRVDREAQNIAERIAELPYAKQQIVSDLARSLSNISTHLSSAAELGAMTAHRLAGIANNQVQFVDDAEPEKSSEALQRIAVLSKIANTSAEIGVNILRANKEMIETMNRPQDLDTDDDTRANSIAARLESSIAGPAAR